MKLVADNETFDTLQRLLLTELVASIRDGLREAGVEGHQLYQATAAAAAAVASIVDGGRELFADDIEVIPVLTFARDPEGSELIGSDAGGSTMHDYVQQVVDQLVSPDDDDDDFDESIDIGGFDDDER